MTSIRPALAAADRSLALELQKMQTVGHLRHVAREIASHLFDVRAETAETVALQNAFERALNSYVESMGSPRQAIEFVLPDHLRAITAAQSQSAHYEQPTDG